MKQETTEQLQQNLAHIFKEIIAEDEFMKKHGWKAGVQKGNFYFDVDSNLRVNLASAEYKDARANITEMLRVLKKYHDVERYEVEKLSKKGQERLRKLIRAEYKGLLEDLQNAEVPEKVAIRTLNVQYLLYGLVHFENTEVYWSYFPKLFDFKQAKADALKLKLVRKHADFASMYAPKSTPDCCLTPLGVEVHTLATAPELTLLCGVLAGWLEMKLNENCEVVWRATARTKRVKPWQMKK